MGRAPAFRFAICQEGFVGWEFSDIAAYCGSIGYRGLELAPYIFADDIRTVGISARRGIASAAAAAGIEITGLHWLLVKPEGMYINHADRAIRADTVDYLKALCDFSADVGGGILTLGSPKARNVLPSLTYGQAWDYAIEALAQVGEHAASVGVVLCLESLPAADTSFLNTAREAQSLADAISSRGVSTMLDVKSMCSESAMTTIPEIIAAARGHFKHFHANDANRKGPGLGDVDFVPIFRALLDAEYDGWVSVEAFDFEPSPEEVAKVSLEYMRGALERAQCDGM